jgi:hypothetical protein
MMSDPSELPQSNPHAKAEPLTTILIAPIAFATGCLAASPIAAAALRIFRWAAGL